MNQPAFAPTIEPTSTPHRFGSLKWEKAATFYARIALGSAFLSAVASRFGLWQGKFDPTHFSGFLDYAREVLAFMPTATIPFFAAAATACETALGLLLIVGLWPRWVSLASSALLAMFATSMAISQGLKEPMDYSVYSASSAALLLALCEIRNHASTADAPSLGRIS